MLMQFPGGYVGDRLGHRTVIVIAVVWAGVATILSGVVTALLGFVALRVITGLGAGLFYSNDRTVIAQQSPFDKRGLGMGFVITGLAIGITLALLLAAPLIDLGTSVFGAEDAWRMPFLVLGAMAVVFGLGMARFFRSQTGEHAFRPAYPPALGRLIAYAAVFLVAILAIYMIATEAGLSEWLVALIETAAAAALVAFVFTRLGSEVGPVLKNRDLMLIYCAGIAILWTLWSSASGRSRSWPTRPTAGSGSPRRPRPQGHARLVHADTGAAHDRVRRVPERGRQRGVGARRPARRDRQLDSGRLRRRRPDARELRAALLRQGAEGRSGARSRGLSSVRRPRTGPSTAATHSHETPQGSRRSSPARSTIATDTSGNASSGR
jgi:MFS transporter